jgi:hypothetical protein
MPQDRDFVIELDGQPGRYRLHVSSPAGDDSVDVGLDPAYLAVDLETLQARVLASATTSRSMKVPELERPLREVGQALFEAVFQASAGALFLYAQGLRAEHEQDWPGAVAHYQAVSGAQPGYRMWPPGWPNAPAAVISRPCRSSCARCLPPGSSKPCSASPAGWPSWTRHPPTRTG